MANGDDGTCRFYDGATYAERGRTSGLDDADNLRFDAKTNQIFIGHREGAIGQIDAASMKLIGSMRVAKHPEVVHWTRLVAKSRRSRYGAVVIAKTLFKRPAPLHLVLTLVGGFFSVSALVAADPSASSQIAQQIIAKLDLKPLPDEGGYFRQIHKAPEQVRPAKRYPGSRSLYTAIYFLITPDSYSALHRVRSDEIYNFYGGDPVEMVWLLPDGSMQKHVLGPDVAAGMAPQIIIPHGVWQGSRLRPDGAYALFGCTVIPGFEYRDFELGRRAALLRKYPMARGEIENLTRSLASHSGLGPLTPNP